jgi:hypothetical protein
MSVGSFGAYKAAINVDELTEMVRHSPEPLRAFAALAIPPTGKNLGYKRGDTVKYVFYDNISNAGGELNENDTVPEASVTPISSTYTLSEYGNSVKLTAKLEKLSRLEVENDVLHALMKDLRSLENTQAYNAFKGTYWKAVFNSVADEFVMDNTPTATANQDINLANLRFLRRKMRGNDIPPFDGENFVFVSGVDGLDTAQFDSDVFTAISRDSGRSAVMGECGTLAGFRLVEDNDKVAKSTGDFDEGFGIGADAVLNDVAEPWYIAEDSKDFGRQNAIAYLGIQKWHKILSESVHGREHVVHVTSA